MGIEIIGEDKTPRLICGRCKNIVKLDIRPFQSDISRLAEIICPTCRTKIFCGLLLLGNTDLRSLLEQIQTIANLFSDKGANVESVGKPGDNTKSGILS